MIGFEADSEFQDFLRKEKFKKAFENLENHVADFEKERIQEEDHRRREKTQ